MGLTKIALILLWPTITLYALSSILFIVAVFFKKDKLTSVATWLTALGLFLHGTAILLRWIETEHGPYLGTFEIATSYSFLGIFLFLILCFKNKELRFLGVVAMPLSFLLIGYGLMASKEVRALPETFRNYWLVIHINFAKLAYGSCFISAVLGANYLLKARVEKKLQLHKSILSRISSLEALDELSYRFAGAGFVFITIMIAAGAVWANYVWGNYWSWDPVETWSLISWLVYCIYIHLRINRRWHGEKAAWLSIGAFAVLLITLLGVGLVYTTVHSTYMR